MMILEPLLLNSMLNLVLRAGKGKRLPLPKKTIISQYMYYFSVNISILIFITF